jgi:hypothetical protein
MKAVIDNPTEVPLSEELQTLKESIVDLYLAIKIRSADEVSPLADIFTAYSSPR